MTNTKLHEILNRQLAEPRPRLDEAASVPFSNAQNNLLWDFRALLSDNAIFNYVVECAMTDPEDSWLSLAPAGYQSKLALPSFGDIGSDLPGLISTDKIRSRAIREPKHFRHNQSRLGRYGEELLQQAFACDITPYTLVDHHIQIKASSKSTSRTLGELDFILRIKDGSLGKEQVRQKEFERMKERTAYDINRKTVNVLPHEKSACMQPSLIHAEVAVKFYLLTSVEKWRHPESWIGAKTIDSLANKLRHTLTHQLALSTSYEALEIVSRVAWFLGWGFFPYHAISRTEHFADPYDCKFVWFHASDFLDFIQLTGPSNLRFAALHRLAWLGGTRSDLSVSSEEMAAYINLRFIPKCREVYQKRDPAKKYFEEIPNLMLQAWKVSADDSVREYRYIVVADGWPEIDAKYTQSFTHNT